MIQNIKQPIKKPLTKETHPCTDVQVAYRVACVVNISSVPGHFWTAPSGNFAAMKAPSLVTCGSGKHMIAK